ncbi:LysM peptidoglycan-binding domain-containing protein, partial [Labilibaculum sp. K2S]|uniref:LysM peptidoglycan-binding domain-containing protein n=1 Tax=Labilibaculum sp. K2S TaxID=3056386 RepID=UPI0025A43D1F
NVLNTFIMNHDELMAEIRPIEQKDIVEDSLQCVDLTKKSGSFSSHLVHFDFGSSEISDAEKLKIDSLIQLLNNTKCSSLCFYGSTDKYGSEHSNYVLAYKRVLSTIDYLRKFIDNNVLNPYSMVIYGETAESEEVKPSEGRFVKISNEKLSESNTLILAVENKSGDIINLIKPYHISVSEVELINGTAVNDLAKEEYILIRIQAIYTVLKGDTLNGIARMFDCSVTDLRVINKLKSDLIRKGNTLIIPVSKNRK